MNRMPIFFLVVVSGCLNFEPLPGLAPDASVADAGRNNVTDHDVRDVRDVRDIGDLRDLTVVSPDAAADLADQRDMGQQDQWVMLSVGGNHACALENTGTVYCWGKNDEQQLGQPLSTTMSAVPIAVSVPTGLEMKWVSVGLSHSCATSIERAYCWGRNNDFQSATDITADSVPPSPALMTDVPLSAAPVIEAGNRHTCQRLADGSLGCWGFAGQNRFGGPDGPVYNNVPLQFRHFSLGYEFGCGRVNSNPSRRACWGGPYLTPVVQEAPNLTKMSVGWDHVCEIDDGTVYCSGSNEQLFVAGAINKKSGHNGATDFNTRAEVMLEAGGELTGATEVSAGHNHACAIANDVIYCWGQSDFGATGTMSTLPVSAL